MTKKEMVKAIATDLGLRPADVLVIVQKVFDGITATLVQAGEGNGQASRPVEARAGTGNANGPQALQRGKEDRRWPDKTTLSE